MQINSKLQFLIDNFFVSFNGQNLFCQIADTEGRLVFLNDYFAKQNAILQNINAIGKSLREFIKGQEYLYYEGYVEDMEEIYKQVLTTRQRTSFFAYAKDKTGNEFIRLANAFPLIAADNELLGTYTLSWFANPFNFLINFMNKFTGCEGANSLTANIPRLSRREHQVLYLLIHKFSQYEIAEFLSISRATVQKVINDGLVAKFNIVNNDSEELIRQATKYGLHLYFPPSLLGNRLLILKNDESFISQIANKINNKIKYPF